MVNWNKYSQEVKNQIDTVGELVSVYEIKKIFDKIKGQKQQRSDTPYKENVSISMQETSEDDMPNLPEGYRDKIVKKCYFYENIDENMIVIRRNGDSYKLITNPKDAVAGGITHYYKAYLAKENQS